jgi:uncharacterized protein YcnI
MNHPTMLALVGALTVALGALPAAAHVRISPLTVEAGSTDTLAFRCPNERSATPTVKLEIQLPPGTTFRTLGVDAPPGWHSAVAIGPDATKTITWTGGTIPPGAATLFTIHAGPMPASGSKLVFKAVQTYGDGEVVRWIQARAAGEAEPPNPAPVLTVR